MGNSPKSWALNSHTFPCLACNVIWFLPRDYITSSLAVFTGLVALPSKPFPFVWQCVFLWLSRDTLPSPVYPHNFFFSLFCSVIGVSNCTKASPEKFGGCRWVGNFTPCLLEPHLSTLSSSVKQRIIMTAVILPWTTYDSLTILLWRLAVTIATPFFIRLAFPVYHKPYPFSLMLIKLEPELW